VPRAAPPSRPHERLQAVAENAFGAKLQGTGEERGNGMHGAETLRRIDRAVLQQGCRIRQRRLLYRNEYVERARRR
jgi:hypothetical protein